MPKYTQKSFSRDLKQLGGMIENFYSTQNGGGCGDLQEGGKKKKAPKRKVTKKKKGGENDYKNEYEYDENENENDNENDNENEYEYDENYGGMGYRKKARKASLSKAKKRKAYGGKPAAGDLRHFKVVSANNSKKEFGVYNGRTPLSAASKAFKQVCKKMKVNKTKCELKFTIKETTQGSKKKEYKYKGSFVKLSKPKPLKFPGMKKQYFQTHKRVVKRVR